MRCHSLELPPGFVLDRRSTPRKLLRFLISTIGVATVRPSSVCDVQVDVGVAAQAPLLHVAVGDFEVGEQQLQLVEVGVRLGPRAEVGLGDDFQQRRAGAVEIDQAVAAAARLVVQVLAGVLFEVGADDADPLWFRRLSGRS